MILTKILNYLNKHRNRILTIIIIFLIPIIGSIWAIILYINRSDPDPFQNHQATHHRTDDIIEDKEITHTSSAPKHLSNPIATKNDRRVIKSIDGGIYKSND